jgi:hypothetical protein
VVQTSPVLERESRACTSFQPSNEAPKSRENGVSWDEVPGGKDEALGLERDEVAGALEGETTGGRPPKFLDQKEVVIMARIIKSKISPPKNGPLLLPNL